jgi:hypothetical protein
MERSIAVEARPDGSHAIRNVGTRAWPRGLFLAAGAVHELPAVAPGAATTIGAEARRSSRDGAVQLALTRTPADRPAALWALDLAGVAGAPFDSTGWLLVSAAPSR